MPVPEAAMHEYDDLVPREDEVRVSREIAALQPKSVPGRVQRAAHDHFGPGVDRSNLSHRSTASDLIDIVWH
jgi:hypothetical protein